MEPFPYILTKHAKEQIQRRKILMPWIEQALYMPDLLENDPDDSAVRCAYGVIDAMDGRVLKVVYNFNVTPHRIISVYFYRQLRGKL
jgi:hypothetical protein